MTSISATSTSAYSPLDLLKSELSKEVSAGKISSTDQSALSSALDDIDSALKSQGSSSSSSTPPSPDAMQSKIDDLIQNEVSSGKLTSDQASELKNVFANTFSSGAGAPPPDASSDSSSSTDSTSSSSSSSTSTADLMKELIALLQNATSQSTSYSSSGSTSSSSSSSSLLVDYKT